ncbi:hypothetical protein CDD81_558 [Ophiocordyceps australis]|uniref:Phospholipase A2 domain-containing protein n=1 Tax=Ophiocordyceps australis TaxID=1399860 RepID=A0A2C5YEJ7_9HYPO|nr:hypothetical protein CDD81_558 [Ophiocordyceps australis]
MLFQLLLTTTLASLATANRCTREFADPHDRRLYESCQWYSDSNHQFHDAFGCGEYKGRIGERGPRGTLVSWSKQGWKTLCEIPWSARSPIYPGVDCCHKYHDFLSLGCTWGYKTLWCGPKRGLWDREVIDGKDEEKDEEKKN